jgi:hypothetical protein
MSERIWTGLDAVAADGRACVICGISLQAATARRTRWSGSGWVAVGRSRTGSQVFACSVICADRARELVRAVAIPAEALTAAGAAFLAALQEAGGDPQTAYPDDLVVATVTAAAPLVVADELRRLAQHIEGDVWLLRQRADQLHPAGGGER